MKGYCKSKMVYNMLAFMILGIIGIVVSGRPLVADYYGPTHPVADGAYDCQRHSILYPQIDRDLRPWAGGIDEVANANALQAYCNKQKGHVCLRIRNGTLYAMTPLQAVVMSHYYQHFAGTGTVSV